MKPSLLFLAAWTAWVLSWLGAAFWSGPTAKRVTNWETWSYRGVIVAGVVLFSSWTERRLGAPRLWHVGYDGAYGLLVLTVAGLAFTWWARLHLGRLWSGAITLKEDHRVVDTGPYALVRHPIYTGLITATLATAAAKATAPGLLGAALIVTGLWVKARSEERFLAAELGHEAYATYRRRVPMLMPFLPPR